MQYACLTGVNTICIASLKLHFSALSHRDYPKFVIYNPIALLQRGEFPKDVKNAGKCHGSTACLRARLSANLRWPKLQIQHYKRIKWFKDIHNYPVYNFKPFFVTLPTPRGSKNLFRGLFLACLHSVSYKK